MIVKPSINSHGFEVGDMVWAKMKPNTWWPGQVYSEDFATPLVRQSKRDCLLLVSLFGSSSYSWFGSSELIPFDSNYADKYQQIDSKTFVRAVEDATNEVSRMSGLGLCCMCGNKQKFRETNVQGFYSVDVAGFDGDFGGVYSIDAIAKARDSFRPKVTIEFLTRLALEPSVSEHVDIDFVKNKATIMSYRTAVYKCFDHVRASVQEPPPGKTSFKAPLSGKVVFADSLAKVRNTAKLKGHAEKDPTNAAGEFTLKDESFADTPPAFNNACLEVSTSVVESSTSSSVAEVDLAKVMCADDEKRTLQEVEDIKVITQDDFASPGRHKIVDVQTPISVLEKVKISDSPVREVGLGKFLVKKVLAEKTGQPEGPQRSDGNYETDVSRMLGDLLSLAVDPFNTDNRGSHIKGRKVFLRFRSLVFQKSQNFSLTLSSGKPNACKSSEDSLEVPPVKPQDGLKRGPTDRHEATAVAKRKKVVDTRNMMAPEPTMLMIKIPLGGSLPSVSELEAKFTRYGPMDHSATHIFPNTFLCQVVFRHRAHAQAAHRFVVGSSSLFGNTYVKCRLKEVGDVGAVEPEPPVKVPKDHHQPAMGNTAKPKDHAKKEESEHSRVLSDLHSLAVDPFNTVNRGSRVEVKKAFLRFRSLVFQNSQNFPLPLAAGEPNASKSFEDSLEVPPVKRLLKRGLSDHQDVMTIAKRKKFGDIQKLTKETKGMMKIDEPPTVDMKQALKKPGAEFMKKTDQGAPGPTMLMIKFPKGGSLPSYNELKARFVRYGPMDHSATHIFWNTFSCQVVFRHKVHAQAAYGFVVGSSSFFGNKGVKCSLMEVRADPEPPVEVTTEDHQHPDMDVRPPPSVFQTASSVQHKSILNRPLSAPLMTPNTDVAQQMLILLTRCNDVVTAICSVLGYTPYHPL
ncbi:hypothetical protein QVD17_00246 [Tagetes erecta]|uniref:PWWP domain-containing protein n=1 Tax=Tagetes erecta TaxID=13708 RepID=A0AAD8L4P4_TARER|nr:hypothetical protein QVD17_00246 [Tagetes erecta]